MPPAPLRSPWSLALAACLAFLASNAVGEEPTQVETSTPRYAVERRYEGHESIVRSVAWRPGQTVFASGASDRTVRLWDAATGASVARHELPRGG